MIQSTAFKPCLINKQTSYNMIFEGTYTVEQAAKKLGVSQNTIRRYINDGEIKAEKVFKRWRIPKSEIEKYKIK